MEKFALGITIGAALSGTFHQAVTTADQKIKDLTGTVKGLEAQKMAVAEVRRYEAALVELTAKNRAMTTASRDMRTQIDAAKTAFHAAQTNARALGIDTGKLTEEEKRLGVELKRTNTQLSARQTLASNKEQRADLHGKMARGIAPVMAGSAPIAAAVHSAVQFESAMADVRKVVDFETPEAFAEMGNDVLRLSTRIPMAASGLSQIIAAAGQSGIAKTRTELLQFAEDAAKMGVAFDIGAAEAGQMMANWRSAMALDQGQAISLANAVNHLSNNMNANAGALGEVLQRQGAVAKAAGLTEIQTASLGAALLSSGAGPEISATALKNLVGALTKGKAATKAQREAFAELGFEAVDMAKMMQKDAPGAIKSVFAALQAMPVEEQSALISQLFGEESKGAIAPLLTNMAELHKAFNLTADATKLSGSMQAEFALRSATTGNNLELMRNRITRIGVVLGTTLLPAFNALLAPIGALADIVGDLAVRFPTLTTVVAGAAVAMVALPVSLVAVRYAFNLMSSGIAIAKLALVGIGKVASITRIRMIALAATQKALAIGSRLLAAAQVALGAAMTVGLGPIGIAIAAVVALGAGAYMLIRHWDKVGPFFARAWEGIKNVFAQGVAFAKQVFLNFTPGGLLIKHWDKAGPFFTNLWQGIKTSFSAGIEAIKQVFLNFNPVIWVKQMIDPVTSFLASVDWSASGRALVNTLTQGIKSAAMAPVEAVKGMLGNVREYLPFSDAKVGPLSSLTASGRAVVTTFAAGIGQEGTGLGTVFSKVFSGAARALAMPASLLFSGKPGAGKAGAGKAGAKDAGAGQIIIHQNLQVDAKADAKEFERILNSGNAKLVNLIRQVMREQETNNRRVSLGGVQVV
ncbi:MAG: phage tail tape measure protein [bacterium]|nr:phage tail tape measure protein [bacterium]